MRLYGGCGEGCTDALAHHRVRRRKALPEVVQFKRDRNESVVTALRTALEEAESGDLTAFVMVKVKYDGSFATRREGKSSQRELVGSLMFAIFDVIDVNHETGPRA